MRSGGAVRVRQLRLLAGWLISLVFALLAVRGVDWSGTWASLRGAKLLPLAAAGVLTIILQGLRATRWGVLLLSLRAGASWGRLFAAVNIGYFFNNILPFRAGDFVRVHLWGKWTDTSRMGVLSTVALERVVDLFCVALLVPVLLRIVVLPRWATWAGTAAGVVSVLAIAGFGCALFYERPIVRVAEWRHEQSPLLRRMGVRQKVGSLLAAVSLEYVETDDEWHYETYIQVYDFADPTNPELVGSLVTDRIQPSYSYYGGYYEDCWDCGRGYYGGQAEAYAVDQALVFVQRLPHNELEGVEEVCSTYPTDRYSYDCWSDEGGYHDCDYYSGSIRCRSLEGGPEACTGAIYHCEMDDEGEVECEEVDASDVLTEENCYEYDRYRYWQTFAFDTLDLSDPANPTVLARFRFGDQEEAVRIIAEENTLHANFRVEADVDGDARPYVRYYVRDIDMTVPELPRLSVDINVPGELIATENDTYFTKDFLWGTEIVETALNRLIVFEGRAYLQARRAFPDEIVNNAILDGNDHMLVTKQLAYQIVSRDPSFDWNDWHTDLVILDLEGDDFPILSDSQVDRWAQLREARLGRALFSVPGGLLVLNTSNPARPFAQSYFPTMGWPTKILAHDRDIFMAAGRYGMYRFSLDSFNLLSAPL